MSTAASASLPSHRQRHQPSAAAFLSFMKSHGLSHYSETLLEHGFHLENLHLLTERDLRQLRVTNPRDTENLLAAGRLAESMLAPAASSFGSTTAKADEGGPAAQQQGAAARRTEVVAGPDDVYTAALPTSNERCRQATIYVEHHAVDRNWPCPGSALARSLALSNATPHSGSHTLYTIAGAVPRPPAPSPRPPTADSAAARSGPSLTGRRSTSGSRREWRPIAENPRRWQHSYHGGTSAGAATATTSFPEAPPVNFSSSSPRSRSRSSGAAFSHPPLETDPARYAEAVRSPPTAVPRCNVHGHGKSAQFCGVCEQQVADAALDGQGQWQYQVRRTVVTGVDTTDEVVVWEPFDPMECLVLEHAVRQRKPRIKAGKYYADFRSMMWGPHRIRRVASSAVPFPTLRASDLVRPEVPPEVGPEVDRMLEREMDESFRRLIITEEEKARFYLHHQQAMALDEVLGEIAFMMDQMFAAQRAALEAEEEIARRKVFDDNFELALDALWAEAERSAVKVQLTDVRRSSENITFTQQDILSKMEENGRTRIELEERAARANLDKLLLRFNNQVKALLKKRREGPVANTTVRCRYCRKLNCTFFHAPWQNHWRQRGPEYRPTELEPRETGAYQRPPSAGARRARMWVPKKKTKSFKAPGEESSSDDEADPRDLIFDRRPLRPRVDPPLEAPYVSPGGYRTVAELIGKAKEVEYEEYLADKKRHVTDAPKIAASVSPHRLHDAVHRDSLQQQPQVEAAMQSRGVAWADGTAPSSTTLAAGASGATTPAAPADTIDAQLAQYKLRGQRPNSASPRRPPMKFR